MVTASSSNLVPANPTHWCRISTQKDSPQGTSYHGALIVSKLNLFSIQKFPLVHDRTSLSTIKLNQSLTTIIGRARAFTQLLSSIGVSNCPFYYSTCDLRLDMLDVTSDLLPTEEPPDRPIVFFFRLALHRDQKTGTVKEVDCILLPSLPTIPMSAGAVNVPKGMVLCCQGHLYPGADTRLAFFWTGEQ